MEISEIAKIISDIYKDKFNIDINIVYEQPNDIKSVSSALFPLNVHKSGAEDIIDSLLTDYYKKHPRQESDCIYIDSFNDGAGIVVSVLGCFMSKCAKIIKSILEDEHKISCNISDDVNVPINVRKVSVPIYDEHKEDFTTLSAAIRTILAAKEAKEIMKGDFEFACGCLDVLDISDAFVVSLVELKNVD